MLLLPCSFTAAVLYPSAVSTFQQPLQQPTTYHHVANTPSIHHRRARHRRTTTTTAATINCNSIPVPRCRTALSAKKENSTTEDVDGDTTPNALIQWIQASPGHVPRPRGSGPLAQYCRRQQAHLRVGGVGPSAQSRPLVVMLYEIWFCSWTAAVCPSSMRLLLLLC